jgi:hypothetical protein
VRNEGQSSIVLRSNFYYEEESNFIQKTSSGATFIPIGEQRVLQWVREYNTSKWYGAAASSPGPNKLGVKRGELFLEVESAIVPDLIDNYVISFDWYPLTKINHQERQLTHYYQVNYAFPHLRVARKPRRFPDRGKFGFPGRESLG